MFVEKFLSDATAAFVGGAGLTASLFILNEHVYPLPNINGRWYVQTHTTSTMYKPYDRMLLKHEVIIWQEGARVHGSSEKIFEASSTGARQYEGRNRSRGSIDGYVTQFYIPRKNRIRLHIEETGSERTSAVYFDLIFRKKTNLMEGIFEATAGSTSGDSIWSLNRYDPAFDASVRSEASTKEGNIPFLAAEAGRLEAE